MIMAAIDDPSPPPPKRYIENEVESGDGRAPCPGCRSVHGSAGRQIACMTAVINGLMERLAREKAEHQAEIAALKVANRAAVEAASLQTSKGGLAETRKNSGGG